MSKLLANQISNYNDNGPVEAKDGINVANGKPFQVAGASGTSGQFLKSTGSSVAWQDFPTIPAAQVNSDWNATSGVAQISNKPTLHVVATSGQYSDLSGLPSIPAAQIQSDWNTSNTSSVSFIQNKPTLFSGAYGDLTGKPTIPSNLGDLADVSSNAPNNNEVLKWNGSNWAPAVDATGAANTDTTYSQSSVASGSNVNLRLTAGGSGSGNDDILITAGNNITISSVTANGFTIASTASGSGATVTTDDSAPSSPNDGDLWWKSDEGRLKVYYADANTSQWVDASPPLAASSSSITNTTTNGTNSITTTTSTSGANANAIEIKTDNNTASAVRWRFTPPGHLIPFANAQYDIGNAEYKVRHMFLSDNTVYFEGDFLKVAQHNSGGSAQSASYLIPLAKLKDALNASADYEAFKTAILAITDA